MDRLWAPWRIKYLTKKKQAKCIFCKNKKLTGKHYVIIKNRYSFSLLNIFPYNNGHVMISPLRHIGRISQLKDAEILDLFVTLRETKKLINRVLRPDGYNIGINISESAGAGIAGHLHMHLVPRWKGDSNFMPVFNNTRVISQSLDELYRRLKNAKPKSD